jgi:CheY-like chemotaxis protein
MLDQEDLKWIATSSTKLNSIVRQISRYARLARRNKTEANYLDLLGERVEFASKTAQALADRVTSRISEETSVKTTRKKKANFTLLPPPPSATLLSRSDELTTTPPPVEQDEATAESGSVPFTIPSTSRIQNPKGHREYLLLIEDEPEVAEMASEMLADEGYKVVVAYNGFEALKIYQSAVKQIALVILDFFLPVIDGDTVFDELRAINPNVNVVLSSGFAEQTKIASMLAGGLRGFIPKPYTREKLLEQVRSALDAARESSR